MADSFSPAKPSRITESGRSSAAGVWVWPFSSRSGTHSLSQSIERVLGIGQLAVAALLKEATASSVLSNTSNTVASFVMCNTSFG